MSTFPGLPHPLVGMWRLVSIQAIGADGTADPYAYGHCPVGYLTYTASGLMMVMFSRGDRPPLSGSPSSPFDLGAVPGEELAQAFASFSAYGGTYSVEGDRVYHHLTVASLPNRVGTTLVRRFSLSGNALTAPLGERLTLTTLPQGNDTAYQLIWQRESEPSQA